MRCINNGKGLDSLRNAEPSSLGERPRKRKGRNVAEIRRISQRAIRNVLSMGAPVRWDVLEKYHQHNGSRAVSCTSGFTLMVLP